jgi:hypothetical protein
MNERNIQQERAEELAKIEDLRQDMIDEIGEDAYNSSGHKDIHDQAEGAIQVEIENDD